jgi:hypothetical protein
MMRTMMIALLSAIGVLSQLARSGAEERVTVLPEMIIGGSKTSQAASERCVEVEIGSSRAFECLNQKLKQQVDRMAPSLNLPPLDARSPDTKIGVVNTPGVQQQYGKNFGVSAAPYRPAPLHFTSPMAPHR